MNLRTTVCGLFITAIASLFAPAALMAQGGDDDRSDLPLEERMEILEEELEKVKLSKATKTFESVEGRGPAASAVYHAEEGLTWGGYGEIKYRDYKSSFKKDQTDVHRFILYAGYRFNDWIVLNSEIEYEHAGFVDETIAGTTFNEAEVFVEMAYIDFEFTKEFQLQVGLNLLPIGITNLRHEPTTFLAVERARTESSIIPSTWREIGAIVHGTIGDVIQYNTGAVTGPRASRFSEGSWIRGGRQKGSLALSEGWGYLAGADFVGVNGLAVGGSYYMGESGQGEIAKADWQDRIVNPIDTLRTTDATGLVAAYDTITGNRNKTARIRAHIAEGHLEYNSGPILIRALYAQGWMSEDDTRAVNKATGNNVGQRVEGGYGEFGYNILSFFDTSHKLYPFFRYERLNTQRQTVQRHLGGKEDINDFVCATVLQGTCKVTSGSPLAGSSTVSNQNLGIIENSNSLEEAYGVVGTPDRKNDRTILTLGVAYFPTPNVVLKVDYERMDSKTDFNSDIEGLNTSNNKIDQLNMAVGFIF
ncbi:MAG: hypothetical protein NXI24_18475 [bacterium]|nr:hypothetical protein [bacterium]